MKTKSQLLYFILFFVPVVGYLCSCTPQRNLVYFSDLAPQGDTTEIVSKAQAKIEKGDILGINIITMNPEYNQLFYSGSLSQSLAVPSTSGSNGSSNNFDGTRNGYLVDENGQVNLPVLGKIDLVGLTRQQAQDKITAEVAKTAKDPIVNVKFLNYKVTVIGEVSHPGSFTVPDERVNVLEALGMAGDMTPYSVRENVLVVREKEGKRTMERLDLTKKEVFQSPYFYLQQNDVVYVQPENKLKARQAGGDNLRIWSLVLTSVSVISLALTRIIN